jgi:subtilisin family serine protease
VRFPHIETLESRRLLAWGTYPNLIQQDLVTANYPSITGKGVNIALIDSGVDFNQPNLQGKFWTNPGEVAGNGKDDDGDGYADDTRGWDFYNNDATPEDQNGHGTALAGIIAAKPFTFGGATYAGIAPDAKVIPLKVSDPTGAYSRAFTQRTEKALQWVEANYRRYNIGIVSMSIRVPDSDYSIIADEVSRLAADGVFMVAAAGQEDPNQDVHYPAKDPNVFAVSVVEANGTFPLDTVNRGPGIDLLAPGDGLPILKRGSGATASPLATSYATPHAAAAAALLKQINPSFTPAQLSSILKATGVNVTDTSTRWTYSGRTYKRLDLSAAVKQGLALADPTPTDTAPPTASASAANVSTAGATSYTFSVTYADNVAVSVPSLGSGDVQVNGPGYSALASLVSVSSSKNGTPRTATYRITPPGGSWNSGDNGTYSLVLQGGQVTDNSGNAAPAHTIGTFTVNISTASGRGTITGTVYHDANGDTIKESTEKQALVATVFLDLNNNAALDAGEPTALSNKRSGVFTFANVAPGTYAVRQIAPRKTRQTYPRKFFSVSVSAGKTSSGLLFGDTYMAFISGVVFNDANSNGVQNAGEAGIANRRVFLDANGNGRLDSGETSVLSDAGGNVIFNSVAPGHYTIRLVPLSGWSTTNVTSYSVNLKAGKIKRGAFFGQHA